MKINLLAFFLLFLSFRALGQSCTLDGTVTSASPTICSGSSVSVTVTPSGGTGPYAFVWSTGESTPTINVNKAGTYTVTITDKTAGCPGINRSITLTAVNSPDAPTAPDVVACNNTQATLRATGPGGDYKWYDAANNGTQLGSGDTFVTPVVTQTTIFYVETTVGSCTSPRKAVTVYVPGNPTGINNQTCAGTPATLYAADGENFEWYDAPTGGNKVGSGSPFVTPPLNATTKYYVSSTVQGCVTGRTEVTAYVNAAPPAPTASNAVVCSGTGVNLHADAIGGVIEWFDVPTGGTALISSPDYTTPALTATTTYYVQTTVNGCVSTRTPVIVTVNPIPPAPTAQTVSTCFNTSATLTATGGPASATYQWYSTPTGGSVLGTGTTFNTPALTHDAVYYVETVDNGCVSARTPINITINPAPDPPAASSPLICSGTSVTLTATSNTTGTFEWYDAPTGGNLLASTATYTTPVLTANTTYYVQITAGGCSSARTEVKVTILPVTTPPTAAGQTICTGNTAVLSANAATNNYQWYDAATGGNLLSSGQVYITPVLTATTTYYVQTIGNNCPSTRTPVTVTVDQIPAPPAGNNTTTCQGQPATVTASTATGTIAWYNAPTGGTLLGTGNSYNTPPLTATTTYYAQTNAGACASSTRTAVTVTVTVPADPQFQYPAGGACATGGNVTPTIFNPAGGTFSASPAGLVFANTSTGEINVSASVQGTYRITFNSNGPCPSTDATDFTIGVNGNASFSYNGPFCQNAPNPKPVFPMGSGAGFFTSSSTNLVFKNPTTGEIDLTASLPGTYAITNTISGGGGCTGDIKTATVVINGPVSVSAGPNQTVRQGSTVQLAGSISTGGGTWSGGSGTFSNTSSPTSTYTPGPTETTVTLTLTTNATSNCGPQSDQMTINFVPAPPAPTVSDAAICNGTNTTLAATAPGGTYQWFAVSTGGSALATGPVFTTPVLTATTIYYVQTTVNGITSNRTPVTVSVTALPTAPTATAAPVCYGTSGTLTASGAAPGATYEWYDAATGGNLLSNQSTYVTPGLTSNTSYYVQISGNGCTSTRTKVDVQVKPIPYVISANNGDVCSGSAQNYTILADIPSSTFVWSRAQVAGISNGDVTGQTTSTITETLINTTNNAITVRYVITAISNGCSGPSFNYDVIVHPTPMVTSVGSNTAVCSGTPNSYTVTFNTPVSDFEWSRAAIPGISNIAVSGQKAGTIREALFNTTGAAIDVTYMITYQTDNCPPTSTPYIVTVNPVVNITSADVGIACNGAPQNYEIKSNIPTATFVWSRAAAPGVSNPPVSNQTSSIINETLNNTTNGAVRVQYVITPTANGCQGEPFFYNVTLNLTPPQPIANSNTPVCEGKTIQLRTASAANSTFLWTGPNNYSSTDQNPDITNVTPANAGTYTLFVITNGCPSPAATVDVVVNPKPIANAGNSETVCFNVPSVALNGTISGGTATGIWTTNGTGTFSSPDDLKATYFPSGADRTAGSVVLTLTSTSKDDCDPAISSITITFGKFPAADAGADKEVCAQATSVPLKGKILITGGGVWTTSGTGTFSPSVSDLNASYLPSATDIQNGKVTLKLTASSATECNIPDDEVEITFTPPPTVNAGGTRYVLKGRTITLNPTVSDENVTYLWTPNISISNNKVKNPVITGDVDRTYTLQITDARGCVSTDQTKIIVSPELVIPNTFTPNGDGYNDLWNIVGFIAYEEASVDVYTRYGMRVYHSLGYAKPWDGTYEGKPLPAGVYYYVINTQVNGQVLSGSVTIIR